jgi:D-serine deaminase-like pyridoxal phosphate-dependent protein
MSKKQLNDWASKAKLVHDLRVYGSRRCDENENAQALAMKWIKSKKANVASSGWATYAGVLATTPDEDLDVKEIKGLLKEIETRIDKAPRSCPLYDEWIRHRRRDLRQTAPPSGKGNSQKDR